MAKITWRGEDDLHEGAPGPSFTTCFGGIKFPKDRPVEVTDKEIISRAHANRFFDVEDEFVSLHAEPKRRGRPPKVKAEESSDV